MVKETLTQLIAYQIKELEHKEASINKSIANCDVIVELRNLHISKTNITNHLNDLRDRVPLKKYIDQTSKLLEIYKETPIEDKIIDVINNTQQELTPLEILKEKTVDAYFEIASSFVPMTINKENINKIDHTNNVCLTCGESLHGCNISFSGLLICGECGSNNKSSKPVSSAAKEYDVCGNLLKAHKRYTGTAPIKFDIKVMMEDLDDYFTSQGKKPGSYYRALPLNEDGRKDDTSQDILCLALKEIGYGIYYKDYMYIGHHYYGWKLHNLRHLEDVMIRNFRAKQEVWNSMSIEERGGQSSLSTQYRLCREYQHAGHKCKLKDFKVSKKKKTIARYDKAYANMCKKAGFTDIFYND
jgi:hypothetical protein